MSDQDNPEDPRRSQRENKGQPPIRYGFEETEPITAPSRGDPTLESFASRDQPSSHPESTSRRSRSSKASSRSSFKSGKTVFRRNLEAELKAAEEEDRLEEEKLERKKFLIQKRLELERVKIEEEESDLSDDNSQKLSESESEEGSVKTFSNPSRRQQMQVITTATTTRTPRAKNLSVGGNSRDPSPPTTEELRRRLTKLDVVYTSPQNKQKTEMAEVSSPTDQLIKTLVQALTNKGAQASPTTSFNSQLQHRKSIGRELPNFSGIPEEWPSFIEQYRRSTKLCGFSDDENLSRLNKYLKGKAKEMVQGLLAFPKNVKEIILTLEDNFGRAEHIIETLIDKAKKTQSPREDKYQSIIDFAVVVNNLVATMESSERIAHLTNPQLVKEFVEKLPLSMKTDWSKNCAQKGIRSSTVKDFSAWMNERADAARILNIPDFKSTEKPKEQQDQRSGRRGRDCKILTTTDQQSKNEKRGSSSTITCHHCEKPNHQMYDCRSFKNLNNEDRWKSVKEKKVCFGCLRKGHRTETCKSKHKCGEAGCEKSYHPLLHSHKIENKKSPADTKKDDKEEEKTEVLFHTLLQKGNKRKILYQIVPVFLKGPTKTLKSYALLDNGSAFTIIDTAIAKELGATGPKDPLHFNGLSEMKGEDQESERVSIGIRAQKKNTFIYNMENVRTKTNLNLPTQSFDVKKLPINWNKLKKVDIESMQNAKPMIIIGQDNLKLMLTLKYLESPNKEMALQKTRLGWTISGNAISTPDQGEEEYSLCCIARHDEADVHQLVKDYFKVESIRVKVVEEKLSSAEDVRAIQLMEVTTRQVGQRWETGLLWKNDRIELPHVASKSQAMRRLIGMEKRIDKDENLAELYDERIKYYLDNGFAHYLSKKEAAVVGPRTWYLPHFGVVNPNKPGKIRFVFDAAAKAVGTSFNDNLLVGPDLLISLPGALIKFRQKAIGFSGDIKDFFHRIMVREEDRNSQRFLWRGRDRTREPDTLVMAVSIFGATCAPYTSQAAKNKNAEQYSKEFPEAAKAIVDRHYMDDYLDSADSEDEAIKLIQDVIEVHKRGGFEIGKWSCSSKTVLKQVTSSLLNDGNKQFSEESTERVLGLTWNSTQDVLTFNLQFHKVDPRIVSGEKRPTKRDVLKVVMSLFDPLGFLGNYTVQGKILLQDIWRSEIGWDDELQEEVRIKWERWIEQLKSIPNFKIPRCYSKLNQEVTRQLHVFCDASEKAYAAVAYLRIQNSENIETAILMAKTRVAPLKQMSIPRLELQAALIASRLADFIKKEMKLEINRVTFWSDSKTVLCWLKSTTRRFKIFVAHRVGEILETTDVVDWRWIPTKENVADEATRDNGPADFTPSSRWINGPEFLLKPEEDWPQEITQQQLKDVNVEDLELRTECVLNTTPCETVLPDIERFSSWLKLIRTTAWMRRFIQSCREKRQTMKVNQKYFELLPEELDRAETTWTKLAQEQSFPKETTMLSEISPSGNVNHPKGQLSGLSPFMDNSGVIRIKGRTENAPGMEDSTKRPAILHPKHPYTRLLIHHHHVAAGHHGQERVVNDLRQKYWILNMRQAVKSAWNACQKCKNSRARPQIPEMGQLPSVRLVSHERPFTYTGIDYFGPMEVTIGRRHEKRYGALFTCLTTRAVHLEIAASLSTDSAIMAIRRFISRRGNPKILYSDNGTNFVGSDNELRKAIQEVDQEKIVQELTPRGIKWSFIPPASPHMGGCWERMVRSVKIALKSTLKERAPKEEVLQTLFAEAEYTVNSRPLTHVSMDPDDPKSLTPNDILIGTSGANLPPGQFYDADLYTRKLWRTSQCLANQFWKRWVREYLPTLTRRTKWFQKVEPVKVNDVVVIVDNNLERNKWPMGIIINAIPGKDGQVRVVDVKTPDGTYRRPVSKIAVLDVRSKGVGSNTEGENVVEQT